MQVRAEIKSLFAVSAATITGIGLVVWAVKSPWTVFGLYVSLALGWFLSFGLRFFIALLQDSTSWSWGEITRLMFGIIFWLNLWVIQSPHPNLWFAFFSLSACAHTAYKTLSQASKNGSPTESSSNPVS